MRREQNKRQRVCHGFMFSPGTKLNNHMCRWPSQCNDAANATKIYVYRNYMKISLVCQMLPSRVYVCKMAVMHCMEQQGTAGVKFFAWGQCPCRVGYNAKSDLQRKGVAENSICDVCKRGRRNPGTYITVFGCPHAAQLFLNALRRFQQTQQWQVQALKENSVSELIIYQTSISAPSCLIIWDEGSNNQQTANAECYKPLAI